MTSSTISKMKQQPMKHNMKSQFKLLAVASALFVPAAVDGAS